MALPVDLVIVRHGESEGNVANRRSRKGDHSAFTADFLSRHSSSWKLTPKGVEQAIAAGNWIRQCIAEYFDRYYVSDYVRALHTAALLGLPEAVWFREYYLRERDRGDIDVMSQEMLEQEYAEALKRRKINAFYWRPPGGESLADLSLRVDRVLGTLDRECSEMKVIKVNHGEVAWISRMRIERFTVQRFMELDASEDPRDWINNGQVIHYTRREPVNGRIAKYYGWFRSVCPWDPSRSYNEWREISRPRFSNEDLLAEVGAL
jgi:NAD+ kinase